MSFKVGQKVVCVYDFFIYAGPKNGEMVTVERAFVEKAMDGILYTFLEIEGHTHKMSDGTRVNYNSIRFRPIDYSFGEETAERIEKELIPETVEINR
jgi:hypothetical protein